MDLPIINWTSKWLVHMMGSIPANKSIPFLYTKRLTTTMVTNKKLKMLIHHNITNICRDWLSVHIKLAWKSWGLLGLWNKISELSLHLQFFLQCLLVEDFEILVSVFSITQLNSTHTCSISDSHSWHTQIQHASLATYHLRLNVHSCNHLWKKNLLQYFNGSLFPGIFFETSGVNTLASTALGITDTMSGFIDARNTVFSLLVK